MENEETASDSSKPPSGEAPTKHFGEVLRTARQTAGYRTLEMAASEFELSKSQLQAWEAGRIVDPDAEAVRHFSRVYQLRDELELFRALITSKYGIDLHDLHTFETELGTFYRKPERVVDEILRDAGRIRHAWFKLLDSKAHEDEVYFRAITKMIEEQIEIRMWLPKPRTKEEDPLRAKLINEAKLPARVVDYHLHYEDDTKVLGDLFGLKRKTLESSTTEDETAINPEELGHPFNETYFFGNKPKDVDEEDLTAYWIPSIHEGRATLLKPSPKIALRYFSRLRNIARITGPDAPSQG